MSVRSKAIDQLEIPVRVYNALRSLGIHTLGELCQWTAPDLCRCPNFGRKSLYEVMEVLACHGLHLRPTNVLDHYQEVLRELVAHPVEEGSTDEQELREFCAARSAGWAIDDEDSPKDYCEEFDEDPSKVPKADLEVWREEFNWWKARP